jgi:exopolysaccharide biosynthesis polyprenyl glycosylphosphotransferase
MKKIETLSTSVRLEPLFQRGTLAQFQKTSSGNSLMEEDLLQNRTLDPSRIDDYFLSPEDFRMELRREKRRVERSSTPLSFALFNFSDRVLNDQTKLKEILAFFRTRTRETDIKGWVNYKAIGLILPDTDDPGMKICVDLIIKANGNPFSSVVMGSYPDSIFENLLNETQRAGDLLLLDQDQTTKSRPVSCFLKRALDLIGSMFGLLLFLPLMALTALAIKVTSPGPVIFKQIRIGHRGKHFSFYKFRSMHVNNDDRMHREYLADLIQGNHEKIDNGKENHSFYKIKNDTRITPVGKIIRRLSIDELPQFFNVLKGEMSLVGPRPPIPYEVEKYKSWHLRRILEIKPGITGLWQVDGRSRTSFDDMVRLDLRYIKEWSFWLDIKIILKTVRAVLETKGAA